MFSLKDKKVLRKEDIRLRNTFAAAAACREGTKKKITLPPSKAPTMEEIEKKYGKL